MNRILAIVRLKKKTTKRNKTRKETLPFPRVEGEVKMAVFLCTKIRSFVHVMKRKLHTFDDYTSQNHLVS